MSSFHLFHIFLYFSFISFLYNGTSAFLVSIDLSLLVRGMHVIDISYHTFIFITCIICEAFNSFPHPSTQRFWQLFACHCDPFYIHSFTDYIKHNLRSRISHVTGHCHYLSAKSNRHHYWTQWCLLIERECSLN